MPQFCQSLLPLANLLHLLFLLTFCHQRHHSHTHNLPLSRCLLTTSFCLFTTSCHRLQSPDFNASSHPVKIRAPSAKNVGRQGRDRCVRTLVLSSADMFERASRWRTTQFLLLSIGQSANQKTKKEVSGIYLGKWWSSATVSAPV